VLNQADRFFFAFVAAYVKQEDVSQCLEIASENLVLDSFGCDFEGNGNPVPGEDSINSNSPIRKLQSSPILERESVMSFESSSSFLALTSSHSDRRDATDDVRTTVDDWEKADEKLIFALLTNEGQDPRFLDMDMSMQPTPPATTLQPTLPPTTLPPTPQRRTPSPTLPPTLPSPPPTSPPRTIPPTMLPTPSPLPSPPSSFPPSLAPASSFPPSACPYDAEGSVDSIVEFRKFVCTVVFAL
jgi:hypothetical protein